MKRGIHICPRHDFDFVADPKAGCPKCNAERQARVPGENDMAVESIEANAGLALLRERVAASAWNETRERAAFEDAAYAFYLRKREARLARGLSVFFDGAGPAQREEMFQRDANGDYISFTYQAAWGGWRMAKGNL